ncbi:unnamed protein product [Owenia fusiformis]|uniref:Uncharacterized protein n=1 Tax=Owenia fusiformis TaxID=6347 RepID=A0A8S4N462_OWEFU|nr:unnamed protein product [Owenia fusiformis]
MPKWGSFWAHCLEGATSPPCTASVAMQEGCVAPLDFVETTLVAALSAEPHAVVLLLIYLGQKWIQSPCCLSSMKDTCTSLRKAHILVNIVSANGRESARTRKNTAMPLNAKTSVCTLELKTQKIKQKLLKKGHKMLQKY